MKIYVEQSNNKLITAQLPKNDRELIISDASIINIQFSEQLAIGVKHGGAWRLLDQQGVPIGPNDQDGIGGLDTIIHFYSTEDEALEAISLLHLRFDSYGIFYLSVEQTQCVFRVLTNV